MKINFYNQKGEEKGKVDLPKEIFDIPVNYDLVHQVIVSQMANKRRRIADTKTRREVRGGGKKPWAQKHMGRARHGSIRSPIFKGGGVVFGPTKEKIFKRKIPQKMKNRALSMVLSLKAKNNLLLILDELKTEKIRTKTFVEMIKNLKTKIKNFKKGSILIALPKLDKKTILSVRNIPDVDIKQLVDLNCLDILSFKYLMIPKDGLRLIEDRFLKNKSKVRKN